jgi:hypothetical protein
MIAPLALAALLIAISVAALLIVAYTLRNGISPMPSSGKVVESALRQIKNRPIRNGTVMDLGSGWGTFCFQLAKRLPNATVIGYETSPVPWLYSLIVSRLFNFRNLRFPRKNFFDVPIDRADLIVCYLCTGAMTRLKPKFDRELRPGTTVISSTFAVPGWKPASVVEVNDWYKTKVYLYNGDRGPVGPNNPPR